MHARPARHGGSTTTRSARTAPSARKPRPSWRAPQGRHACPEASGAEISHLAWSNTGGKFTCSCTNIAGGTIIGVRPGPHPLSLLAYKALEADHVMRLEVADFHRGQERMRSNNRPDRFMHSDTGAPLQIALPREAPIDCRRCWPV